MGAPLDPSSAAKDRDPRLPETSAVGSLPDTQEGRGEGPGTSAATLREQLADAERRLTESEAAWEPVRKIIRFLRLVTPWT